jgi:AhpD family alkylhydroperoxidase
MSDDRSKERWPSYTMVDPKMRKIYFCFYQETYRTSTIDRETKELIAIAAYLASRCDGCLEEHIRKALKFGVTREELSETIAITMGVNAAAIGDFTDKAAEALRLRQFDAGDALGNSGGRSDVLVEFETLCAADDGWQDRGRTQGRSGSRLAPIDRPGRLRSSWS